MGQLPAQVGDIALAPDEDKGHDMGRAAFPFAKAAWKGDVAQNNRHGRHRGFLLRWLELRQGHVLLGRLCLGRVFAVCGILLRVGGMFCAVSIFRRMRPTNDEGGDDADQQNRQNEAQADEVLGVLEQKVDGVFRAGRTGGAPVLPAFLPFLIRQIGLGQFLPLGLDLAQHGDCGVRWDGATRLGQQVVKLPG